MAILEAATVQLVSVWFAFGGFCSIITSVITDNIYIQIAVFVLATAVSLIATRPIVRKIKSKPIIHTNSDKYIGKVGIVTQTINNTIAEGQVRIGTSLWTARSIDNEIIEKGTKVKAEKIEGVKLIVSR